MAASLNWGDACESHSPPALFAGDDWNVVATFTDAAGNPLDLTGATIMWALLDRNGKAVFVAADFTVAVGPQPGQCTLTVPAASTTKLSGGSYKRRVVDGRRGRLDDAGLRLRERPGRPVGRGRAAGRGGAARRRPAADQGRELSARCLSAGKTSPTPST
jgi:hypothetical protein